MGEAQMDIVARKDVGFLPCGAEFNFSTYEDWLEFGHTLEYFEGKVQFVIGDWLNYGERKYGEKYAQATNASQRRTWQQYAWVAANVEIALRNAILGFHHHKAVAPLPPSEQRKYLSRAEHNGWSVSRLRTEVKKTQNATLLPPPEGVYNVVYADCPWEYSNTGVHGAAQKHYDTMPTEELCELPKEQGIRFVDDAVLFMWATNPLLEDALQVISAWGFEYKTNIAWVKTELKKPGSGFYVRGRHELLLICTRGSFTPVIVAPPIGSVLTAPVGEHSRKPVEAYEIIERLYPNTNKLELFARAIREGWDAWGDQVGKYDAS
jgi:N6-adenosine-specific RNA methylase IME4